MFHSQKPGKLLKPNSYSSVIKSNKKVQLKDANTQTTEISAKSQAQESTPSNTKFSVSKLCPTGKRVQSNDQNTSTPPPQKKKETK